MLPRGRSVRIGLLRTSLFATLLWSFAARAQASDSAAQSNGSPDSAETTDDLLLEPAEPDTLSDPPASTRYKLIGVGLGSTAVWYAGALGLGALWPTAPGRDDLRIPVAGPFMDLAQTGCPEGHSDCSTFELVLRTTLVVLDGLGQAGGVGIALEGIFLPTAPPASVLASRQKRGVHPVAVTLAPRPWVMPESGAGVMLSGSF